MSEGIGETNEDRLEPFPEMAQRSVVLRAEGLIQED